MSTRLSTINPAGSRRVRLRTAAKLNLSLAVFNKRSDGYHNLETVFQTISLTDQIDLDVRPSTRHAVEVISDPPIEDNIARRAALEVLRFSRSKWLIRIQIKKRIPMGGGLGGGSSDAAAMLLAVPAICGFEVPFGKLWDLAAGLGSDVPFFLLGGTALGVGRGTEIQALADVPGRPVLVVAPDVHVSTAKAYAALGRGPDSLTSNPPFTKMKNPLPLSLCLARGLPVEDCGSAFRNDFEPAVFGLYPELAAVKRKLIRLGAQPALMTGSGAAVFGFFRSKGERAKAQAGLRTERTFQANLIGRGRYQAWWRNQLREYVEGTAWPPRSRFAR